MTTKDQFASHWYDPWLYVGVGTNCTIWLFRLEEIKILGISPNKYSVF